MLYIYSDHNITIMGAALVQAATLKARCQTTALYEFLVTNTGQKFDHNCFIFIPPPTAASLLPNLSDTIKPSIPVLSTTQVIPP